ncbi:MAG: hypothetical protein QM723_31480 [Myxococcaceae bacterium]
MRKLGLLAGLCLITMFACDNSQPQSEEEQFLATHQDALGVFTTTTGILTLPGGQLPANLSFEKVRAFYPVVCLDLDSDHDGIPDSFDLHFDGSPKSINPSALPHPCKRCNRGPGVNGDFRLHVMGTNVDLQRGRVSTMGTNVLSIPSPDGPITVTWTSATEIKDGPVGPGAEVRVRGTMTANNTIAADSDLGALPRRVDELGRGRRRRQQRGRWYRERRWRGRRLHRRLSRRWNGERRGRRHCERRGRRHCERRRRRHRERHRRWHCERHRRRHCERHRRRLHRRLGPE